MPLKSKEKAKNDGTKKAGSKLNTMFRRYNPDKVTINGLKNFFGLVFYKTGYDIEIATGKVGKKIGVAVDKAIDFIGTSVKTAANFLDKLADTILDDLGEPLDKIGSAFESIGLIIKEAKADESRKAGKEVRRYIREGLAKNKVLAKTLYYYTLPVVTCAVFCLVVSTTLSREYALEISLDGQPIGVIENYTVLKDADKIISNKLVTTGEQTWNLESQMKVVTLREDKPVSARQLANNILSASDENIVEATGLYVNGEFIGPTENFLF